jgi:hypothetical protein
MVVRSHHAGYGRPPLPDGHDYWLAKSPEPGDSCTVTISCRSPAPSPAYSPCQSTPSITVFSQPSILAHNLEVRALFLSAAFCSGLHLRGYGPGRRAPAPAHVPACFHSRQLGPCQAGSKALFPPPAGARQATLSPATLTAPHRRSRKASRKPPLAKPSTEPAGEPQNIGISVARSVTGAMVSMRRLAVPGPTRRPRRTGSWSPGCGSAAIWRRCRGPPAGWGSGRGYRRPDGPAQGQVARQDDVFSAERNEEGHPARSTGLSPELW